MAPTLYMVDGSSAVRNVLITADAIGLELEHKIVNLIEKEQFKPEYINVSAEPWLKFNSKERLCS